MPNQQARIASIKKQSGQRLSFSQLISQWIADLGVKEVFSIPGSHIDSLTQTVNDHESLSLIIACHELGAGFMADGYARASLGKAICLTIGGPGAAYAMPSAIVSRIDSSPVVYLTGEPPSYLKDKLPFQDAGELGTRDHELFKCSIDYSYSISESENPFEVLKKVELVLQKNLPVNLSIPLDVQESNCIENWKPIHYNNVINTISYEWLQELVELINNANYPVILIGDRFIQNGSAELLLEFVTKIGIPVATTFCTKGILPESHPLSLGNFGFAGSERSHNVLFESKCDLLIFVGSDMGQRETFDWDNRLKPAGRTIINIDTRTNKPKEYLIVDHEFVVENCLHLFATLLPHLRSHHIVIPQEHIESEISSEYTWENITQVIRNKTAENTILFVDSGIHRTAAGIYWKCNLPYSFYSSDKVAPMGWAIAAAIGGKLARPDDPVLVFTGDGCMRMHGMEIATAVRYKVAVIFVVFNNASYASIQKRLSSTTEKGAISDLSLIDWIDFGKVLGAAGSIVSTIEELVNALQYGLSINQPYILDVRIDSTELVKSSTLPKALWPPKQ